MKRNDQFRFLGDLVTHHNDSRVFTGRIVKNIRKVQINGKKHCIQTLCQDENIRIGGIGGNMIS